MRRLLLLLVAVLSQCAVSPHAIARAPGGCDGIVIMQGTTRLGCMSWADFLSTAFTVTTNGSGGMSFDVGATVSKFGSCLGDVAAELCATVDATGKTLDVSAGTLKVPVGSGSGPTAAGSVRQNSSTQWLEGGDGSVTRYWPYGLPNYQIGGTEGTNAFTYAGQGSGSCSGDICRGGTCSGTTPTGTCTLDFNSSIYRSLLQGATSIVLSVKSFTWTAGTITIGSVNVQGGVVIIRARDFVSITSSGTFNLRGKGSAGTAGGTCVSTTAGKSGGSNSLYLGSSGGTSAPTAGAAGNPAVIEAGFFPFANPMFWHGSGGGAGPVTGNAAGSGASLSGWGMMGLNFGATGGGGGGCPGSCTSTIGAGGAGGGMLHLETGGSYDCSGATIDVRGADGGGSTASGGGGGGVHVLARVVGTNTCTYSVAGGAAGTNAGNCSAGAAGGTGASLVETYPR